MKTILKSPLRRWFPRLFSSPLLCHSSNNIGNPSLAALQRPTFVSPSEPAPGTHTPSLPEPVGDILNQLHAHQAVVSGAGDATRRAPEVTARYRPPVIHPTSVLDIVESVFRQRYVLAQVVVSEERPLCLCCC